jgi:hypothetical protein
MPFISLLLWTGISEIPSFKIRQKKKDQGQGPAASGVLTGACTVEAFQLMVI